MSECEINPCVKQEYESELTPVNTYYGMAYEVESLESIQNPNDNHIYLVDGTAYVYVDGEFKTLGGGGSGGESKPFYPIVTFDGQMQVTDIQQGVVSARSGTVIGRMMGAEMAFSVIGLMNLVQNQPVYRYFVSLDGIVFELILNSENEITSVRGFGGGIYVCTGSQLTIDSKEIRKPSATNVNLVEVDPDTSEEIGSTSFIMSQGGKKAVGVSQIVPLNYGLGDTLLYNPTVNVITFDANSKLYYITSI